VPPNKTRTRSVSPTRRWAAGAPQQHGIRPEATTVPVQALTVQRPISHVVQQLAPSGFVPIVAGRPPPPAVSYVPPLAQQVGGPRVALSAVPVPVYKWASEQDVAQQVPQQMHPQAQQGFALPQCLPCSPAPILQQTLPKTQQVTTGEGNMEVGETHEGPTGDSEFMRLLDSLEVRVDLMAQMQHTRHQIQARTRAMEDETGYSGLDQFEDAVSDATTNGNKYLVSHHANNAVQEPVQVESSLARENSDLWTQLEEQREIIRKLTAEIEDMRGYLDTVKAQSGSTEAELRSKLQESQAEMQQLKQLFWNEQQSNKNTCREWEVERTKLQVELQELRFGTASTNAAHAHFHSQNTGAACLPTTPVLPIPQTQAVLSYKEDESSPPKVQPFNNSVCGVNVALSEDGYVGTRTRGCRQSVLIGSSPIPRQTHGWYFEVEIRETVEGWVGGVGIGITSADPANLRRVPDKAWRMPNTYIVGYWGCVFLDGQEKRTSWKPDMLKAGTKVGLLISDDGSGDMRVFVDLSPVVYIQGALRGLVTPSSELYAVVDVFAATLAVALQKYASPPSPPWQINQTYLSEPASPSSTLHPGSSLLTSSP